MKYLVLLFCMSSLVVSAQTKRDYMDAMSRYVTFYNNDQMDSICAMFPKRQSGKFDCFWAQVQSSRRSLDEYGRITSYKYIGLDTSDLEPVRVFRVVFAKKGVKATSFTLHDDLKFGTFRFDTSSDEIERMLNR